MERTETVPVARHVGQFRILYGRFTGNYGNFAERFARASKVIRLIRYQRNERTPRPSCSLKCKTFSYRYARSRDTFFSKQVPYQGRPPAERERGMNGIGVGSRAEEGRSARGEEGRSELLGIGQKSRESPHMKPLSAPIQQYFYIYYPLHRCPPFYAHTP